MHEKYFDITCQKCPRLAAFLCDVKEKNPTYYAKPVAPFGDDNARLLIVGLAPGMHGANATGRPFTGDYAGILLYEALYEFGFSSTIFLFLSCNLITRSVVDKILISSPTRELL